MNIPTPSQPRAVPVIRSHFLHVGSSSSPFNLVGIPSQSAGPNGTVDKATATTTTGAFSSGSGAYATKVSRPADTYSVAFPPLYLGRRPFRFADYGKDPRKHYKPERDSVPPPVRSNDLHKNPISSGNKPFWLSTDVLPAAHHQTPNAQSDTPGDPDGALITQRDGLTGEIKQMWIHKGRRVKGGFPSRL